MNTLKNIKTRFAIIAFLLLWGLSLQGASITISLVKTTMPQSQWDMLTSNFNQYEQMLNSYAKEYDFSYSTNTDSDSIDFIYTFEEGWHWRFYKNFRDEYLALLNDAITQDGEIDPGYRWDISVKGEIDPENNPWRDVNWLQDVEVHDGSYLGTKGLGWFYAPGWNPDGSFWAWAYEVEFWNWIYFWGNGFYHDRKSGNDFYNWPGTTWIYNFETQQWEDFSE